VSQHAGYMLHFYLFFFWGGGGCLKSGVENALVLLLLTKHGIKDSPKIMFVLFFNILPSGVIN
jgi:hypothetical protein